MLFTLNTSNNTKYKCNYKEIISKPFCHICVATRIKIRNKTHSTYTRMYLSLWPTLLLINQKALSYDTSTFTFTLYAFTCLTNCIGKNQNLFIFNIVLNKQK